MKSLIILGRQPELGLAELESLYGADKIKPVGGHAALLELNPAEIPLSRLGGSVKVTEVLTEINLTSWRDTELFLSKEIPNLLKLIPEGKLKLGISTYGIKVRPNELNSTGLRLKKIIKAEGRSVRIVPNKSTALNSAQVLHNQLISPTGLELVLARDGNKIILAKTIAEQDIEAYAKRDQDRPMRDAKVGMLPPKLAQLIINLSKPELGNTVLDPFCGTGVVLQEALLMGFNVYGTDLESRMIDYSRKNIDWLRDQKIYTGTETAIYEVTDATSGRWQHQIDRIAGETYLGKPLSSLPPKDVLQKIIAECDYLHTKFLSNIANQIKSGTRLCLAVPAWRTKSGFLHLKTLAKLDDMGYNRQKFVHVGTDKLIYHRPDQTVARELVVLVKK